MDKLNIFQKMLAITSELGVVAKNLNVDAGRSFYKAVSERDVIDHVKPLEEKYGIYSYPVGREVIESNLLESETEYNGKITRKTTLMSRIKTTYRFVNVHNPSEFIETITFAEGMDSQDKGSGKAMTYADKYALMKAYKISTGDDPDQDASKDTSYSKKSDVTPSVPQMSSRDMLMSLLYQNGVDIDAYAKEHNLTKSTSMAIFDKLLNEFVESQKVDTTKGFSSVPGGAV